MSFRSIVRELREMKDGIGSMSKRVSEGKHWRSRTRSQIAIVPDEAPSSTPSIPQSRWANLPPELLLDILRRVEDSETSWPARAVVIFCASVCRSWRDIIIEIVKTPEQCGRITFPISLKQSGPRESPIQCFIRRDRATSTYYLYLGLVPSESERHKLLLAAKKIRRTTNTDFAISLVADDFSRTSTKYVGKLRSNFLGTKFTIYDSLPPCNAPVVQPSNQSSRRFHSKHQPPRVPSCNYSVGSISYELNVLRTRGPRRLHCVMHSIPGSCIKEGASTPTPTQKPLSHASNEQYSSPLLSIKGKEPATEFSSTSLAKMPSSVQGEEEPLILKNKAPRWHEQLQCWCLNFKGRVTVASVKNFQLVAAVNPSHNISDAEQERVILQFGKIGKDIFTMDYRYPLSAFQAFSICLSSFDTKPACE
ncbi:tubby-like F-box protein 5 [Humulus lupulus]|uniref:tubby-like F-box protein 5 n=1 Tax=Humulus lupulus TaxID=3486 RepID=UPI002B40C7EE|nr:tubby-like F-box protein 5 [Humulus lupulus]XP_062102414.1 tubby-like F-box protein 5 [Humulus lupulus]XP_062102415.1 tubby-like F-box protein 5 [Humulus lupulus]